MRALIRKEGETVTENDGIEGIDWATGAPLTNEAWCGGPYTLVQNYVAPTEDIKERYDVVETPAEDPAEENPETIVIDGVTYTRSS